MPGTNQAKRRCPVTVAIARLYTDAAGESHFGTWEWPATPTESEPPAEVTEAVPAEHAFMLRIPAGWYGEPHPAPRRQLMVVVSGCVEATASDGETRRFTPGSAILLEDTTGQGHRSRAIDGEVLLAVTQLSAVSS
jgi:hypothetical protein